MGLKSFLVGSRLPFLLSLLILGGLIALAGYLMCQQMGLSGSVVEVYGSEVARLGDLSIVSVIITNREGRGLNYTLFVSVNLTSTDTQQTSVTVFIPSGNSFRYNLQIIPRGRGVVAATITVYGGEERVLVDDITHYVAVQ